MKKSKKKGGEVKGKKITLAMARSCLRMTVDGKRRLDLSKQGLASVPKCILSLCDVEELDLSRNLLKKLPDFLDKFVNLRFLDVHSNYLEYIPESIGRLQNLLNLNLCNNRLTTADLPSELGLLGNLRKLNLGLNQLETVPRFFASMRELRQIGLFDNRLTRYPECLRQLRHLERVNMDANPFPPPPGLPADLDTILKVDRLYLVRESRLCPGCLARCESERRWMEDRAKREAVKSKLMFAGLVVPNSVAQEDQGTWR